MKLTLVHLAVFVCIVGAFAWYNFGSQNATAAGDLQPPSVAVAVESASCSVASAADCGVRITLIKFHGDQQCTSCVNLGKFADSTLRRGYSTELAAGTIRYLDINAQSDPTNELVVKYRPTHASLYMVVENGGNESFEELTEAWYYTGDEQAYSKYLSGVLDSELGG